MYDETNGICIMMPLAFPCCALQSSTAQMVQVNLVLSEQ